MWIDSVAVGMGTTALEKLKGQIGDRACWRRLVYVVTNVDLMAHNQK